MIGKLVEVLKKFFEPLTKRPLSLFTWPAIVIIVCWLYVTTGVGELARHNSDEALFLAADAFVLGAEPISELSPDFTEEGKSNAKALRAYVGQIQERHLAAILQRLHPEYSPKERLLPLLARLEAPGDQQQAQELIWTAGVESDRLHLAAEKFARAVVVWFKSERLDEELVRELDEALGDSRKLVEKLQTELVAALSDQVLDQVEQDQAVKNALAACQANRRTMLLLFLARMGYGSEEKINEFLGLAEKTSGCKVSLAGTIEDPEVKRTVLDWAQSEQRRVHILKAMLDNDMDQVRGLLREAIDKALKEKEAAKSAHQAP
ncbi:MAG: hypothetical protein ACYS76_03715 [Planctomycetota bacterium]|jgi:hypothetical protein